MGKFKKKSYQKALVSSPGPKVQVNYCHHLASVVCKLFTFQASSHIVIMNFYYSFNKWNKMNCELMLTYDTPALRQTGSRNLMGQKTLPTMWKSDIWSQASYRYPISWEAVLDPSDFYFLFADFVDFYTHLTYICICTFF
jgi:hypothetical protein